MSPQSVVTLVVLLLVLLFVVIHGGPVGTDRAAGHRR